MAEVDLDLVKQKFDEKKGGQFPDFQVTVVDGTSIMISSAAAPWSPLTFDGEDGLAELLLAGLLHTTWQAHRQYLGRLFGEDLVG